MTAETSLPYVKAVATVLVLFAVIANAWSVREAIIDLRWVYRRERDEAFHVRGWQSLRDESAMLALQIVILWVRFWSTFWPDPGNHEFSEKWIWDVTILTIIQVVIAGNCLMNVRDRRRTIGLLMRERKAEDGK